MDTKEYIFELNGQFCKVAAFNKQQAFDLARIYGFNGSINEIRRF